MKRFPKFLATGVLVALSTGPALAQQGKDLPNQGSQGQAPATKGMSYSGVNQNPWFGDKSVRDQLKFSGDQFNGLNKAHQDAWTNYNANVGKLGTTLTAQERTQKMQELNAAYNQSVSKSAETVITDPEQRQRYNQLHLQYQGYGAFNDPMMQQKLNLTNEQRQKLSQYGQEWNQQMGQYQQSYQADPQGAAKGYNDLNKQTNDRFNSVLTDQQKQMWRQMTGATYNFPPSVYFQGSGSVNERSRN